MTTNLQAQDAVRVVPAAARILVVDDEPSMREMLSILLRREGYDVTVADNGKSAIELLQRRLFDMLISDIKMPDVSGVEVLRQAKELNPSIIGIMVTAYGSKESIQEVLRLQAADYIDKPFNVEELKFRIRKELRFRQTEQENQLLKREPESLVIVNEFGEVPVDHLLVESSSEKTRALPNGCLCCHLRGDLEETLIGAAMRRRRGEIAGFDRVIVETSGLADPGPVAQTLYADAALGRDYKLGSIVTVVDAADTAARSISPEIARNQIAAADLVVLSKVDRAGDIAAAEAEVRSLNPAAACISASFGEVDASAVLQADVRAKPLLRPQHGGAIRSFAMKFDRPVRREILQHFLATLVELRGKDLLRVKGLVPLEEGLFIVQGVRHVLDRLRPASPSQAATEPALVFITNGIEGKDVESLWEALKGLS